MYVTKLHKAVVFVINYALVIGVEERYDGVLVKTSFKHSMPTIVCKQQTCMSSKTLTVHLLTKNHPWNVDTGCLSRSRHRDTSPICHVQTVPHMIQVMK
jgi:hypothetical protein